MLVMRMNGATAASSSTATFGYGRYVTWYTTTKPTAMIRPMSIFFGSAV